VDESRETRLKRLRMRSWRRGTREMDLILGPFADGPLAALDDAALDAYEALLGQADPDLYAWICGAAPPAEGGGFSEMLERLRRFHRVGNRIG
jgi:antitoxin CptB